MLDDEAEIEYRVCRWLDHVGAQWARLRELDGMLQALDATLDGLRGQSYEAHGRTGAHADLVGGMVAERAEKRAQISDERESIVQSIGTASSLISRVWAEHPGVDDASFTYLLERYGHGLSKAEASRAAGLTSFAAMGCARKVASHIYQADPSRFGRRAERIDDGHGYAGMRVAD